MGRFLDLPPELIHFIASQAILRNQDRLCLALTHTSVRHAVYHGHGDQVSAIDPSENDSRALYAAMLHGDVSLFRRLSPDPRVNLTVALTGPGLQGPKAPPLRERAALSPGWVSAMLSQEEDNDGGGDGLDTGARRKVLHGRVAILFLLMDDARFDPSWNNDTLLVESCQTPHYELVHRILQDPRVSCSAQDNLPLRLASELGHGAIVRLLLQQPDIDPRVVKSRSPFHRRTTHPFVIAATHGKDEIVSIYMEDGRVDPSDDDSLALRYAARQGHAGVVRILLADGRSDPGAADDWALREACRTGNVDVVALLLGDERVDPAADNNDAVRVAAQKGHAHILRLLLQHPRTDPTVSNNDCIRVAGYFGETEVIEVLLQDPRVDPTAEHDHALRLACKYGHIHAARRLLRHAAVDPGSLNSRALLNAAGEGHTDIVALLLTYPQVDPSAGDNEALRAAVLSGSLPTVKLLLQDARVDPRAVGCLTLEGAARAEDVRMLQVLTRDKRVQRYLEDHGLRLMAHDIVNAEMDDDERETTLLTLAAELKAIRERHKDST